MIEEQLSASVLSWLYSVKTLICRSCDEVIDLRSVGVAETHIRVLESLVLSATRPNSELQLETYFRHHMRCTSCGATDGTISYMTADELVQDRRRRGDEQQLHADREAKEAEKLKFNQERVEGKHGFWADDSPNGFALQGTRAYDPIDGTRDGTIWNPRANSKEQP